MCFNPQLCNWFLVVWRSGFTWCWWMLKQPCDFGCYNSILKVSAGCWLTSFCSQLSRPCPLPHSPQLAFSHCCCLFFPSPTLHPALLFCFLPGIPEPSCAIGTESWTQNRLSPPCCYCLVCPWEITATLPPWFTCKESELDRSWGWTWPFYFFLKSLKHSICVYSALQWRGGVAEDLCPQSFCLGNLPMVPILC